MWIEITLCILTLFFYLYYYVTKQFDYFKKRGVPFAKPSFPYGSSNNKKMVMQEIPFNDEVADLAENEMKKEKIFGYFSFGQPIWVINDDPELTKRIFVSDFDHFVDVRDFMQKNGWSEQAKIGENMFFNMKGDTWKKSRALVTQVFTSGKIKVMTPHMAACGQQMEAWLKDNPGMTLDSKELSANFALDAIATSGFGIESNCFKNPNSKFRRMAMEMINHKDYASYTMLRMIMILATPRLAGLFNVNFSSVRSMTYLANIVKQAYAKRLSTGERRNDIVGLLVDEIEAAQKRGESVENKQEMLIANAMLLFLAGYDTVSSAFTIVAHHLLANPEYQDKLAEDIHEVLGIHEESDLSKEVTYENIMDLKYLDMVVQESFRLNTFISHNERMCTKDYKIPGTDYVIEKGRFIKCYVRNFAKRSDYFMNPDEFDPQNFAKENNPNKFGVHLFGHGPRSCIGMRYAIMSLKMCIIHVLKRYRIVPCNETVNEVKYSLEQVFGVDGIKFKLEPRKFA